MNESHPLWFLAISLALAFFPLVVGVLSSYLKVSIVLGFFRSGLGAQQVPGPLVIMGLSLGITLAVMAPVLERTLITAEALPLDKLSQQSPLAAREQLAPLLLPWREFLENHTGERELLAFAKEIPGAIQVEGAEEKAPWSVLLPAFLVSQLREAFTIGFLVLLPFLVIDIVVANILVGMGMFMLSPIIVSLPLKILLFLMADGWLLLTGSLVTSFGGGSV